MKNNEIESLIENKYLDFLEKYDVLNNISDIEYIGINFNNVGINEANFKIYYKTTRSLNNDISLLQPLIKRNIVHALNKIDDIKFSKCTRYEIGLQNRTNTNMLWLYHWIENIFPQIIRKQNEIIKCIDIRCSDLNDYCYASMYFLGLIVEDNVNDIDVKALKLHYILRKLSNPDKIGKNYVVDKIDIMSKLERLNIKEINYLLEILNPLLEKYDVELWMLATDYFKKGNTKYKIYLKFITNEFLFKLGFTMREKGLNILSSYIEAYVKWITKHPKLEVYGIAICYDTDNGWSINLYH